MRRLGYVYAVCSKALPRKSFCLKILLAMLKMTRFLKIFHYHGPKFEKKKFDLNSATSGAGLAEAIFSCFEASANPAPRVVEFKSIFFFKFWSMAMEIFQKSSHFKHCK